MYAAVKGEKTNSPTAEEGGKDMKGPWHYPVLLFLFLAVLLGGADAARSDSLGSLPDLNYSDDDLLRQEKRISKPKINYIIYPVLGLPSIVEAGGDLRVMIALADGGTTNDWKVQIQTSVDAVKQTYDLLILASSYDSATGTYQLIARVDTRIPEDCFDIVVRSISLPGGLDRQPNAVKVVTQVRNDFDIIHISDTHVPSPLTMNPGRILYEMEDIRLMKPEFVIFSGDWGFGHEYGFEYEDSWNIFKDAGFPCFMVPGNHDGYATVIPTGLLPLDDPPGKLYRDGLNYWRQYVGPLYYSFDYGRFHVIAVNSYGGSAKRRNGYHFVVVNWGGHMGQEQLDWFERDARAATQAGKEILVFLHHDPSKKPTGNKRAYPIPTSIQMSGQDWNDPHSAAEFLRIIGETSVSHVFLGHTHDDDYKEITVNAGTPRERKVPFVHTMSTTCGTMPDLGYRRIRVRGGMIAELHYDGLKRQSIPAGNPYNLAVKYIQSNDGSQSSVMARIENQLFYPVTATVEFYMQAHAAGYSCSGGTIHQLVAGDGGEDIAYVKVDIPAYSTVFATVEPDPQGNGARPGHGTANSPSSAGGSSSSGGVTPTGSGGGGGGSGGCTFAPSTASSSDLIQGVLGWLPVLFSFPALYYLRRRKTDRVPNRRFDR
jgi:predicted phosphodiesterase